MQAIDNALLRAFVDVGQDSPALLALTRWMTELGGSAWLVPLSLAASALLLVRGHRRRALALILITLGGRLVVELFKYEIDRFRPQLIDYQLTVYSQSFPSGHAANSMIVYLALALISAPLLTTAGWPRWLAVSAAVLIGLTRPVLGVHWPSDVLAGWALGVAWTLTSLWLLRRWMGSDPAAAPRPLSR